MLYGLCGKSLKHSYSGIIHNLLGNGEYKLINLAEEEFVLFMKQRQFDAVNVTIPYKILALTLCDCVSDEAKRIGCVNTVVNKNGKLYGYNTDCFGFKYMLERAKINPCGKKVLILGNGGTSLTARCVLEDMGAKEIINVSRTGQVNYENVYDISDAQIIINTTPVGMYPNNSNSLINPGKFPGLESCADVIYNPLKTKFISDAENLGLRCGNGLSMLVAQAVKANELFFDKELDNCYDVIDSVESKLMSKVSNIVLVGMPGSGKTTVGKLLAEKTGMTFYDTDEYIENKFGRKIPDIINNDGEPVFRKMETEVLEELTKLSGCIIATGGGAVLEPYNRHLLKQNGKCIYIKRDIEKLATSGRPLSEGGLSKLYKLYDERKTIYEKLADFSLEFEENSTKCAEKIKKVIFAE